MLSRPLSLAISLALSLSYPALSLAATHTPRTCDSGHVSIFKQESVSTGGIGGTGHETTIPPGGIGGTEHKSSIRTSNNSGIGGTGHETTIPPGGIGGTEHDQSIRISDSSGIGGTGHEATIPPGGIGGTGHESTIPPGGIGGTGHESITPPGGIGGTGIMAAGTLVNVNGVVTVEDYTKQTIQLASGDEICLGDRITSNQDAKAKIVFADGAMLYVLKNTEINLVDYHYSAEKPETGRSLISILKGDIRSVSGKISKLNPQKYSFQTPASTIRVIGTDFLVTHLPQQEGAIDAGTYTKVISGEVSVQSATSTIKLRAGESSHVMLNGTQSIITSGGGSCAAP
jgi:hypothetical protein